MNALEAGDVPLLHCVPPSFKALSIWSVYARFRSELHLTLPFDSLSIGCIPVYARFRRELYIFSPSLSFPSPAGRLVFAPDTPLVREVVGSMNRSHAFFDSYFTQIYASEAEAVLALNKRPCPLHCVPQSHSENDRFQAILKNRKRRGTCFFFLYRDSTYFNGARPLEIGE